MRRRNGPLALFWALLARSLAGYPILANGHWNDVFCVSWMTGNDPPGSRSFSREEQASKHEHTAGVAGVSAQASVAIGLKRFSIFVLRIL
jgi:hypothetical protein